MKVDWRGENGCVSVCACVCTSCLSDMTLTDGGEVGGGRGLGRGSSFLFVLGRCLLLIGPLCLGSRTLFFPPIIKTNTKDKMGRMKFKLKSKILPPFVQN